MASNNKFTFFIGKFQPRITSTVNGGQFLLQAFLLLLLAEEGNGVRAGLVQNSSRRSCAGLPTVGAAGNLSDIFVMGVMWAVGSVV